MDRQAKIGVAVIIGLAVTLAVTAMLEPRRAPLFPDSGPVTEEQFRQKLQAVGYSDVKIEHDGTYLKAVAVKDGRQESIAVDGRDGQSVDVFVNDVD